MNDQIDVPDVPVSNAAMLACIGAIDKPENWFRHFFSNCPLTRVCERSWSCYRLPFNLRDL